MHDLDERLTQLERSSRRWRWATLSLVGLGLLGAVQVEPSSLTCSKLEVVGPGGRSGIILAIDAQGNPSLILRDDARRARAGLSVNPTGGASTLWLTDQDQYEAATLTATKAGGTLLLRNIQGDVDVPVREPMRRTGGR